jgi:peptidoglycan hydrolase-like protein with peptidoglycan-binding domain
MSRHRLGLSVAAFGILAAATPTSATPAVDPTWAANHLLRNCFTAPACGVETSEVVARGNVVALWQQVLIYDGVHAAPCQDGVFGPVTERATRTWQREMSAYATDEILDAAGDATTFYVDGIVGPQTWLVARSRVVPTGEAELEDGSSASIYHQYIGRNGGSFDLAHHVHYALADGAVRVSPLAWYFDDLGDAIRAFYPTDHPAIDTADC